MSKERYSIINKNVVHDGPVRLRIDTFNYNGKVFRKEVVEHSPSVGILPTINKKQILLIKQFRHAVNKYLVEIPAGKIESNESPYDAAKRELAEETGYTGVLKSLTRCFLAPSYDTELMHFFVAENVTKLDAPKKMDEDENIINFVVELDDAIKYCYDGTIIDCKTVTAIFLYYFAHYNNSEFKNN